MFTRARWFVYGAVATLLTTAYLFTQVRRLHQRMTAQSVARAAALTAADVMAVAGRWLARPRGASPGEG